MSLHVCASVIGVVLGVLILCCLACNLFCLVRDRDKKKTKTETETATRNPSTFNSLQNEPSVSRDVEMQQQTHDVTHEGA